MSEFKKGSKVKFTKSSEAQVNWGSNDDPELVLNQQDTYVVKEVEQHKWHTKLCLEGIEGKFNSVSFKIDRQKNHGAAEGITN